MKNCNSEQEYLDQIIVPVQKACKRYGYLPSVLIAQSCLENGYGIPDYWDNDQIGSLIKYNNMVGIKTELLNKSWTDIGLSVWPGESLTKRTPEEYNGRIVTIKDSFRKYDTIEQSFADYLCFMTYASNYGAGGDPKYGQKVLKITDPGVLIRTVSSLGYATGSTYAKSVMRIIEKHNLTKYDDLSKVVPTDYIPEEAQEKKVKSRTKRITDRKIIDITAANKSEVPRSRGRNPIQFIVIHYLGVPNADNPYLYGGGYGGHYNIQRDGSIYLAADPHTAIVWHCGGGLQGSGGHQFFGICTNSNSIGIECGVCYTENVKEADGDSNKWYFTEESQESLVWLVSYLMHEYGISMDHVIRHFDVTGKICPNPYVKNNNLNTSWTWQQFKDNLTEYRQKGTITIPGTKDTSEIIRAGQIASEEFTGVKLGHSGKRGPKTRQQAIRVLQRALQLDYGANIKLTGKLGPATRLWLGSHYVKRGETQYMVTAAEIMLMLQGIDPHGVEYPGIFGAGLQTAAGTNRITAQMFIEYTK